MIDSNVSFKVAPFAVPNSVFEYSTEGNYAAPAQAEAHSPAFPHVNSNAEFSRPYIEPRQFHLSEIPANDLALMCEEFKKEVFSRAGKSDFLLASTADVEK